MTNGYFYDAGRTNAWVPHGIAYQTWNRPLGVWQTFDQIDYDLDEMKKMGANSIRVDFVWQHIEEDGDNQWKWENYDYLVQAAEARGLRIFALIGYQWPPNWFPDEWYTMHPPDYDSGGIYHPTRWRSDIINYERPEARAQYQEWFQNVCSRYKDSKAIVAWIIGNESGFLGLWSGLLDGYDPECEAAFRGWCQLKYGTMARANETWGSSYTNFNEVTFPSEYRAYGVEGAVWADAVQWREDAIASFTAVGAAAAKAADTNHLISYSTVGMQWGEEDWRYHAEDRGKITEACAASNAPVDFFSVNNYPWSILGHESQNGHWGISYTKKVSGIPVLYSETGFTSSETMWPGMNEQRQGPLIRNAMWESLEAGAIGTHVFAWHDRPYITDREKGFGILYANRVIKPAFWVCRDMFTLMDQSLLENHLRGSADPTPDVAFLWTAANDSQYNRYECEMQQIAGTLERLGYEPWFMDLEDLAAGAYTNYRAIILPRNMRVETNVPGTDKGVLEFLRTVVISNGVNVIATGDLPGLQDFNGRPMTNFVDELRELFGVDASDIGGYETPQKQREYVSSYWAPVTVRFTTNALGPLGSSYTYKPYTWKYSDEIMLSGGTLWAEMDSLRNKSFERGPYSGTSVPEWGVWGTLANEDDWGWALDGTNMIHLWGDSGLWQDFPVVPFGRYTVSTYLRSNHDDPLRGGAHATVSIEWYDKVGAILGTNASARLASMTPGDSWVQYKVDAIAPSNAWTGRRLIRCGGSVGDAPNLIANGTLAGTNEAPDGWNSWNNANHAPAAGTYQSASNAWVFWWDSGIFQSATNTFMAGDVLEFSGYLLNPGADALRNGDKYGSIELEFYSNATLMATHIASPVVSSNSPSDTWIYSSGFTTVPAGATRAQFVVRCSGASGDGRFYADDLSLSNKSPGGAVYVDNKQWSPAVVTKNHGAGAGKAAIFLYGAGDNKPDGNEDTKPDVLLWKWRYEVFASIFTNYFGIPPKLHLVGTNACYALADYRTCTNGSILMQLKNYLYDTNYPTGGDPQTFTIVSDLVTGKTIRAFQQCYNIETNSDGVFQVSLPADGQEMLLAYPPSASTNNVLCQIADAPSTVHPYGDQTYGITVKYDSAGKTGLVLKVAFIGTSNKIYQILETNCVAGAGENTFWMWIPDPDLSDPNYNSTAQGSSYEFKAWMEDSASNQVAVTLPRTTALEWGIAPTSQVPLHITKGDVTNLPVVWEDMYEQLYWQNTPLARGVSFPPRVAVYRSSKTERFYSNQYARVNEVCDWLESLGYESANLQDVSFDNVTVSVSAGTNSGIEALFADDVESGTNDWTATGLWRVTTDLSASPGSSWAYYNGSNYATGARSTGALTRVVSLSNATSGASLRFKSWYETEDTGTLWDRKLVQVSTNGTDWKLLLQISGTNKQWVSHVADLGAYAGTSVWIRFYFDTIDSVNNQYRGWRLDDVEIVALQTETAELFAEDMESPADWTADGLWRQTGSRGGAEVSGTNRWVYNSAAVTNYSTGQRTTGSLVSPWIDLSDRASARLTFKSWYETEDEGTSWDRKLVYVSTNGSSWTRIYQVAGTAGRWNQETVELVAYAGSQIRLKFTFDSIDAQNNGYEGWYVDDVSIASLKGFGSAAFSDRTESGTNGWTAEGLWHQASDLCFSASRSWAYNNGLHYDSGARNSGALISPWIDLTEASGAALSFQSWFETEDAGTSWDRKLVYVTTNGTQWEQVSQISGPINQWCAQTVDLSPYSGGRIRLKFFFDTVDNLYNFYRGWYVDDIEVRMTGVDYVFVEDFSGPATNWTRAAGAANWDAEDGVLRAWRIGNDDNILYAGDAGWTNYSVSANIRYNTQGPYFSDAEIYLRYQDRNNYVKVGIRNFYGAWRLKYTVREKTNMVAQGWIYEFNKTSQPVEGLWYRLRVSVATNTYTVFFDGNEVGSFTATNFASGRIALGSMATQLGIWEPQKGYFFIDDDEYSYTSPSGETLTIGSPLNLDWGYLVQFFPMLILPGTYVMNDTEAANVGIWLTNGLYSLMATDGGVAMKDETGADDPGRLEQVFGVGTARSDVSGVTGTEIGTNVHYATLDYTASAFVPGQGSATAWRTLNGAVSLGTLYGSSTSAPALICHVHTQKVDSPPKAFCFNYAIDTGGQMTNEGRRLAQRAFEWVQGQAYRLQLELKYVLFPGDPDLDIPVFTTNYWILNGWGASNLNVHIPMDNVMTGTNLYWVMYAYPWDATNGWTAHKGFFSSGNDSNVMTTLDGFGLQLLGITEAAYAGRDWDMWVAYNTQGSNLLAHFGLKDKGDLEVEDNFNDGNTNGWTVTPHANVAWGVENGSLRASVTNGGYAWITRDGLSVTGANVSIEFDARWMNDATNTGDGGLLYRGVALGITPRACGWRDAVTNLYTNNLPVPGVWHHVLVNIRDGAPYLRSDLLINGKAVFLDDPIEATNWASSGLALLSPYFKGSVEWDNFRVADEEYTLTTQSVYGLLSPTNANFWPSVPDYDPDKWEYDGTALGGQYQWYIYFKGEGVHGWQNAKVYFSPRLMVEDSAFPSNMNAGESVAVPIEWENLGTNQPARLYVHLENPFLGQTYTTNMIMVTNTDGSAYVSVDVPATLPANGDYSWSTYLSPTNATNLWLQRVGSDDSFRFDALGMAVEPETVVWVHRVESNMCVCFSDIGLPEGARFFTWLGIHDGDYTNPTPPPEGVKSWRTLMPSTNTSAGWGVFYTNLVNLGEYAHLKFWMKTEESTVKVQIEAPLGTQKTLYLDQMGWNMTNAGQWQEISVPITNFGFAESPTNVYGAFMATLETMPSRYAFSFPSENEGWVVMQPGSTHGINLKQTTNSGASWMGRHPGGSYYGANFYGVDFLDPTNGWISGYNVVLATTNGGESWAARNTGLPVNQSWYDIDFFNSQTGWVCGSMGVARTVDGGLNWSSLFTPTGSNLRAVHFVDSDNGWAAGTGFLLKTTNGGVNWAYVMTPSNGMSWRDVVFLDPTNGWACGQKDLIIKTTNSGATWQLVTGTPMPTTLYLYSMCWPDATNGWVVGSGNNTNNMFFTHDGGATWRGCTSSVPTTLLTVKFTSPQVGYAGGGGGYLVKTTNGLSANPVWKEVLSAREFYTDHIRWTVDP